MSLDTRIRQFIAEETERQGTLDVAYCYIETPLGRLLLAATKVGISRVAFESEDHNKVLDQLNEAISVRLFEAPRRLEPAVKQITEYFEGTRQTFDLPLDLCLSSGFKSKVLQSLHTIDYGNTESYGSFAEIIGNARASRAVGTACATNPIPIIIPCHRIIRSTGEIGEYIGGTQAKKFLIDHENRLINDLQ